MPKTVSETPGCENCPMRRLFPQNTFVSPRLGRGTRLVICEAPGEEESLLGEPLVGGAGKWLRGAKVNNHRAGGILPRAGIRDEDVTFANCIQCRPPENVFPTDAAAKSYISPTEGAEAVQHCWQAHLRPLLVGRHWSRIDLLGDKPLRLVGGLSGGIFKWRGSPIAVPELGPAPIAIPTLHPAFIMRDQTFLPVVINDLKKSLLIPPERYNLQPSLSDVQAFQFKTFAFDIETNRGTGEIIMVGLCAKPYEAMVVPFQGAYKRELKRIFENAENIIGQNCIAFDVPILFAALELTWQHTSTSETP